MLAFCGNGTHLTEPWVNEGFSLCFYETVTSSIIFGFMMLFGITQICVYRRFSTNRDPRDIPFSRLYRLQITLSITMLFVVLLRIALEASAIGDHQVYIYQMMSTTFNTLVWPVSLIVMWQERHYVLPSIPTRGHGLVLLIFWTSVFVCENMAFISWFSPQWWWRERNDAKNTELGLWTVRYICSAVLFGLGFAAPGIPKHTSLSIQADDVEALLGESSGSDGQRQQQRSTWSNVFQKMKLLWPSVWPKKSPFLQFLVIMCLILLGLGRVCNLFTPIYYKKIVDSLTIKSTANESEAYTLTAGTFSFRWDYVLVYIVLRFLQGGGLGTMGLLNNMRSLLWIKVQQYTTREIGVDLYSHLHSLSLRWHLSRKTGEVLRVMDRGTNSINQLLSYILFQIAPTIIDISVAIIYFLTAFNAWFALIVFATMALFLTSTILVTEWRTKFRREMNKLDNLRNAKGVDSLINFETVKYYGAESFEVERYRKAVVDYQKQEWVSTASLNLLNTIQNFIITGGFAAGAMLSVYYVANDLHGLTVGDFVLFSTYIMQLYTPLNWLGTYYRMIQQAFIDMENMFDLLSEEQEVKDIPGADDLQMTKGYIEFSNVTFHYEPRKPILKGVSFFVPPGQTIALVGPSGSGKSTIIRLLFRFYDVQGGFIKFDGQDITTVTQKSLRQAIGVVPQDTVLFNDDIRYNIRYGRVTASDEDLENSAIAADIHERILGFTDGYQTKVGERGLKLSGGEKQRVAIARTILKAPQIVLLDEATSALDTQTERNIQTSLARVCENRTTIIVAHRLSTIIHADQILVLKDGEILERGRHDELLAQEGMYANMWQQQLTKNEDMESSGEGSSGEHSKLDVKHQ